MWFVKFKLKDSEKKLSSAASLLLKGAAILQDPCLNCSGVQIKYKNQNINLDLVDEELAPDYILYGNTQFYDNNDNKFWIKESNPNVDLIDIISPIFFSSIIFIRASICGWHLYINPSI